MNEDTRQLARDLSHHRRLMQRVESLARQAPIYPGFTTQQPSVALIVQQTAHGFTTVGQVLKCTGTNTYALAKADTVSNAQVIGVVGYVINVNAFVLVRSGVVRGLSGLSAGTRYYLSASTAGAVVTTAPPIAVQIFDAISTSSAIVNAGDCISLQYLSSSLTTATGAGTFVVPVGVTRVRARLSGGGGSGGGGQIWDQVAAWAAATSGGAVTTSLKSGAAGGGGGAGAWWDVEFDTTPGETLSFSVGTGGAAGSAGADGAAGAATTLTLPSDVTLTAGAGGLGSGAGSSSISGQPGLPSISGASSRRMIGTCRAGTPGEAPIFLLSTGLGGGTAPWATRKGGAMNYLLASTLAQVGGGGAGNTPSAFATTAGVAGTAGGIAFYW